MGRILIVDDEPSVRRILAMILRQGQHEIVEADGLAQARGLVAARSFDVVITDQHMTDGEGLSLLTEIREADPSLSVVMVTAYATVELAVEAMKRGAFDFLAKPFAPETVIAAVGRAIERTELLRENESLRGTVRRLRGADRLVGESASMVRLKEMIQRVAPTAATVLVTGETGTGKELVARAVHDASPRTGRPFVAVNCAALAETLLDGELFGHERGAFTGADRARQGVFETAHRGTLFLDEAGEMTLPLQAKLLRVLVDGLVTRIGSNQSRQVDVRVIVATHRNLEESVRSGQFREDLYYRLAVVPLAVPSLRERPDDLPLLIDHLRETVAHDLKMSVRAMSPAALEKLLTYRFPGNVRELRNLIERAYILSRTEWIEPEDLMLAEVRRVDTPATRGGGHEELEPAEIGDLRTALDGLESRMLQRALAASGGVQAQAARLLGISRSDMNYKLKKHGIDV